MGLRTRLRDRVRQTGKDLLERIIGEGAPPGTNPSDAGPAHAARTSAWPPAAMGEVHVDDGPPVHPADAAASGDVAANARVNGAEHPPAPAEIVAKQADFSVGSWDVDADVAPALNGHHPEPEPEPEVMVSPMGSVAQEEWLPMPKPAAAPEQAPDEPEVEAEVEGASAEAVPDTINTSAAEVADLSDARREALQDDIVVALKTVYDPEIPVDIYELGLIYGVDVQADGMAHIQMTLTSPNCPAAQSMPSEVETKTASVDGVRGAVVDIVWDPPWGPERMSEAARLELNIDF